MFSVIFLSVSSLAPFLLLMLITSIVFGIPMFIIAVNLYQKMRGQFRSRAKKENKPKPDDQDSRLKSEEEFNNQTASSY